MYQSEAAGFRPGYSHTLAPKQGATSSQPDPPHTRDLCWLLWVTTDLGGPVDTGLAGVSTLRGRQYGGDRGGQRENRKKKRPRPPSLLLPHLSPPPSRSPASLSQAPDSHLPQTTERGIPSPPPAAQHNKAAPRKLPPTCPPFYNLPQLQHSAPPGGGPRPAGRY